MASFNYQSQLARMYATTNAGGGLLGGTAGYSSDSGWYSGTVSCWSDQTIASCSAQSTPKLSARDRLSKEINDWHGNVLEVA